MAVAAGDAGSRAAGPQLARRRPLDASERAAGRGRDRALRAARGAAPDPGAPLVRAGVARRARRCSTADDAERRRGCAQSWPCTATAASIPTSTSCCSRRPASGGCCAATRSYDEDEIEFVRAAAAQPHVAPAWNSGLALMEALRGDRRGRPPASRAVGAPARRRARRELAERDVGAGRDGDPARRSGAGARGARPARAVRGHDGDRHPRHDRDGPGADDAGAARRVPGVGRR